MYDALATSDATAKLRRAAAPALTGLFFAALGTTAHAQTAIAPGYSLSIFAAGAAIHATGADSLTVAGGDVFVGYANGVDSAGAGGNLLLDDQGGAPLGTAPLPSLTLVTSPGRTEQKTSLLFPKDEAGKPISLDDTRFAPSGARRLLIADTKNNVVYLLSGPFRANEVYCATKGTGTVGALNLSTGVVTPLVGGPGSPHGLAFITGLSC